MVKVAAVQMASGEDASKNFALIEAHVHHARSQGAQLVVLPEECLTLGMEANQRHQVAQAFQTWSDRFSDLAQRHRVWLVAGTLPQAVNDKQHYSTSLVFCDQGSLKATYRKIHLFDVQVDEQTCYRESEFVCPGDTPVVFDSPWGTVGLSICYDIRFPELYRHLVAQGAKLILIPSAFTPQTGQVHWEVLVKARAIENLSYVVAPNQCGRRANGQGTWGHSLIVDPWGATLSKASQEAQVLLAQLDMEKSDEIRTRFGALAHRRL